MASIGDTVFLDSDMDGVQDAGEPGVVNATVFLYVDADMDGVADGPAVAAREAGEDHEPPVWLSERMVELGITASGDAHPDPD